jgi:hypothetical protein
MLEQALAYSKLGWPVFPCKPQTKKPATKHGFKDATCDESKIRSWWRSSPTKNIAIRTGSCCNVAVIDVDPRNAGDDTFQKIVGEYGPLPETVHAKTGGGGDHYYFTHPGGRVVGSLGEGIDVKADGGYVMAAPSIHETGKAYRWAVSPFDREPAVMPGWLVPLIQKTQMSSSDNCWESESLGVCASESLRLWVSVSVQEWSQQAISRTLPSESGQRNRRIFDFARQLKGHPELADAKPGTLKTLVRDWFRAAQEHTSGEHTFEDCWAEFAHAWPKIRFPAGTGPIAEAWSRALSATPPQCAEGFSETVCRLVCFCRELQRQAGDKPFYLGCRAAALWLGIDHNTANKYLSLLDFEGVLERVFTGQRGKASEFIYKGD